MTDDEPHYHGHRQRLRERFLKSGLAGFADYEVVELLLTLAIPRSDVKQLATGIGISIRVTRMFNQGQPTVLRRRTLCHPPAGRAGDVFRVSTQR